MVLLRKGDSRVWKIAEKRELRADRLYRLSGFVFPYENDGIFLLKNTLTKRLYRLEKDEFDAAMSLRERSVPLSFLTEHGLELLGRARFIVEEGYDETAQYLLMLSIMRTLQDKRPGIRGYTILPTTGCNARCVYCYEEGIRSLTMTPETADRVVDFIVATKWDGAVTLHWFGGEPLAAPGIISRICRALEERGVRFTSTIITNGTLLTPEMADEARDVWKLKTAQVSLDGARVDYEARKRYVNPGEA